MDNAVNISPETIDKILDALRAYRDAQNLPSELALRMLVETALWAGLRREEGRQLSFAFAYISPSDCNPDEKFEFESPRDLDEKEIVGIAPALLPKRSRLGVTVIDHKPIVWGITLTTKPCVKVRALAPGRVAVKYGLENIAVLEPPDLHIVAGNLQSCMKLITSSIAGAGGERPVLAAMLLMVVDAVRRQGNGGTLLVGPHGQRDWIDDALWPKFLQAETSAGLADELSRRETAARSRGGSEFEAAKEDPEIRAFLNGERVAETLWRKVSAIGQLSAVDGAVVVDDQLHLIDFGTKIDADEPPKYLEQEIGVEGETEKGIGSLGGTRHRSAAAFVDCRHDAVAFVASHDGPLSLFVYNPEKKAVVRWRRLERLID